MALRPALVVDFVMVILQKNVVADARTSYRRTRGGKTLL
jgi:hypothetical protein